MPEHEDDFKHFVPQSAPPPVAGPQGDARPDAPAPAGFDPASAPKGALSGLCLTCGAVKSWISSPCQECGADSTHNPDLHDLLSEQFLHHTTVRQFSVVFRILLEADVSPNLREWTLYSLLRESHPSLFTVRVPRSIASEIAKIREQYHLPPVEVKTSARIMPADWDDHQAWDEYYSRWDPQSESDAHLGSDEELWHLSRFRFWIDKLYAAGCTKLWLPGCGLDFLPLAYAAAGFRVWASDASIVAIDIQRTKAFQSFAAEALQQYLSRQEDVPASVLERLESRTGIELHLVHHDFRTAFPEGDFDYVINMQALQSLPPDSLGKAAKAHFAALRPGGRAYFSMLNVDPAQANLIEDKLEAAGFFISFRDIERRYRDGVARLGLRGIFLDAEFGMELGRDPGKGLWYNVRRRFTNFRLRQLRRQYQERKALVRESVDRVLHDGETKVARPLYNTG